MSIPDIKNLIKSDKDICQSIQAGNPFDETPLTPIQLEQIETEKLACSNTEQALYAGLRLVSDFLYLTVENEDMRETGIRDASWIMKHLTDELEAVCTLKSGLSFRVEQAYKGALKGGHK